jgi:LPS export ABC transporter protein LptC
MSRFRFFILCFLGGFLVVLGIILWNAHKFPGFTPGSLKDMLPANVDMRLNNLILSQKGDGKSSLRLEALTANYFKDKNYFILTNIVAHILSSEDSYEVTAENGRYEPDQNLVTLTGQVRTADSQGRIFSSPRISLNMENGIFSSSEPFCLENPTFSLSGQSLVYDSKRGYLEVHGQVQLMLGQSLE